MHSPQNCYSSFEKSVQEEADAKDRVKLKPKLQVNQSYNKKWRLTINLRIYTEKHTGVTLEERTFPPPHPHHVTVCVWKKQVTPLGNDFTKEFALKGRSNEWDREKCVTFTF